jgi:acid phosphatase type 7
MNIQPILIKTLAIALLINIPFFSPGTRRITPEKNFSENTFLPRGAPIVIYGDTRNGHAVHKKIVACILKENPCAVFHTGDLVFNGKSNKDWNIFNSIVGDLLKIAPIYTASGNHERGTMKVNEQISLPNDGKWYSVDIQNMHFIVLDVCDKYATGSEQYNWLVKDLENQPKTTKFTIAITHYPVYCTGPHRTGEKKIRKYLVPLFKKYGVDAVFSGHNHCYERAYSDGIYYIITAGGGAPLYGQTLHESFSQLYSKNYNFCTLHERSDSLFIVARDTGMKELDKFFISYVK